MSSEAISQKETTTSTMSDGSDDSELTGIHGAVEQAVVFTWNNQYDDALDVLRSCKDTNPRFACEWAYVYVIKTLMSSTNEDRESLLGHFKIADSLASSTKYNEPMFAIAEGSPTDPLSKKEAAKQKKRNKKSFKVNKKKARESGQSFDDSWKLECDVIYAESLLMRAMLQLMMNSYLKGGINLRKAWGCFHSLSNIVEKDTENRIPHDIKMCVKYGTGVFYTFLALVPANLMKLLSIIGFISDKDLGEQYLNEVFESNTIRSPYAALTLCTLYLFLPTGLGNVEVTLARAKVILDRMNEKYPNNTYFNGYANFYHRKRGETQAAVEAITLADRNAERAGIVPLLIRYLHADTLFMDQNWSGALERYKAILTHLEKTKEKFAYTGQITLSIAACYVMLGNDGEGMMWINKVNSMYNPKSKSDSNSPKFSNRVIANPRLLPLTGVFMLYINRDLAHMNSEQGRRVMSELNRVTSGKDLSGPEAENMLLLFKGVIEKGCGDTKEAIICLRQILANEKTIAQDSMILPFTYYELAEIEYHQGNLEVARDLFDKGWKIKGDGNETLSNRYTIAMKQLKRKMQEEKKK